MTMPDAELATALKQAKGKKMFFAFIPKGGSDGQLIVSKTKIPPKQIAEAKKHLDGVRQGVQAVEALARLPPQANGPCFAYLRKIRIQALLQQLLFGFFSAPALLIGKFMLDAELLFGRYGFVAFLSE
jgi:hypothetical protein